MTDEAYCYPPDFVVLRNKLGLTDAAELDFHERELVSERAAQGAPTGNFDLPHLRAIHRHLFQDVYDWAGELRTVEIAKDGNQFQFSRYIATGMADVHRRLVAGRFLKGLGPALFAARAAPIIGDINYVHPFREGNGRTQAIYLEQLAAQAGHRLSLRLIGREEWLLASRRSHGGDHTGFAACIVGAIRS